MNSWYEAFGGREIRSGRGGELYTRMHASRASTMCEGQRAENEVEEVV